MCTYTADYDVLFRFAEHGIRRGNEESHRTENRKLWKKYFLWEKKNQQAYFFSMKFKMMDLCMKIEGTKLIFIMNFSVLDFFKFVSRMPQIAQIELVLAFKIFPEGGGGVGMPLDTSPPPPRNFLFFFSLAIPGSGFDIEGHMTVILIRPGLLMLINVSVPMHDLLCADCLVGLVVKASALREEDPGFKYRIAPRFFWGRVIPLT